MKSRNLPHSAPRRPHGFTLVELLVAVALGMLVMVALIAVYLNVSRTNSEMSKTNGMIENGRFAIDVLNEDLSHAGYWGGFVPRFDNFALRDTPIPCPATPATDPCDVPSTVNYNASPWPTYGTGPCLDYASWTASYRAMLLAIPVEVYGDGTPPGCSATIADRKAGTDVVIVRHADTCLPGATNCDAFDSSKVYFQSSQCANEITSGPPWSYLYDLSKRANLADFPLKKRGCTGTPPTTAGTQADVRKLVQNIYYIRTYATTSGDGIPTLVRATYGKSGTTPQFETVQPLIEGVEAFRVELGVDEKQSKCAAASSGSLYIPASAAYDRAIQTNAPATLVDPTTCTANAATPASNTLPTVRGDGIPDHYDHCGSTGCTISQLMNTVSAKVFIIARSKDATPSYTDTRTYTLGSAAAASFSGADANYKRHVFQTTIRMTNVSGRRETPLP